jgi:tetratricopeptide (TPR) repeat protein
MKPGAIFSLLILMWIGPAPAICQANSDDAAAARIAFAAGNYQRAANLYEQALARHGPSAELPTDLGLAYQMRGEHSLAISSYLAALRLEEMPRTRELLAIERCRLRQYHTVTPLLARIAGHLSGDDALLPVLSACYLQAEDAIDALRVSKILAGSKTMPPDQALIYRGHASIAASNLFVNQLSKTAGGAPYLRYLKTARDAGSADARGGVPLAIAHSSYLRSDLTLDDGLTLYAGHAGDPALLYMLSVLAGEQAMQSVLDCQQQFSDSPWLAQFQAEMLAAQGQPQQAKALYTQLLASEPELPELRHDMAMLFRAQGEWSEALRLFQAELAADPSDDRAVTGISESLVQLGKYKEAVAFLEPRFLNEVPPLWAVLDLSLAYQKSGSYSQAIMVLTGAEKHYPREKQIHFRLMRLYTLTGRMDRAQEENTLFAGTAHP